VHVHDACYRGLRPFLPSYHRGLQGWLFKIKVYLSSNFSLMSKSSILTFAKFSRHPRDIVPPDPRPRNGRKAKLDIITSREGQNHLQSPPNNTARSNKFEASSSNPLAASSSFRQYPFTPSLACWLACPTSRCQRQNDLHPSRLHVSHRLPARPPVLARLCLQVIEPNSAAGLAHIGG